MTKFLRLVFATCLAFTLHFYASAQSVSINTDGSTAHASALLDVKSTAKGVLVPRMNKTERNAIASPATGLMVFQNAPDSVGFYYYDGTTWLWLATANSNEGWLTTGNAGTTIANHFFGTTDNVPLSFRQNNFWTGRWNSTTQNYFTGDSAGSKITSGLSNVAFGGRALYGTTSGFANAAVGNSALSNNTSGSRNTAVGDSALFTFSFNGGANYLTDNTAIGSKALFYDQPTNTGTGIKNVAVGNEAMYQNTIGNENTALGVSALRENTTGSQNTAVGRSTHRLSKSGFVNSYFGYAAGFTDSIGNANTGIGGYSLYNHQKNDYNTAVGYESMEFDSSGSLNSSLGWRSLRNNKSGVQNVAIGTGALELNSTGSYNVAVGRSAGFYVDTVDFVTGVGFSAATFNKRERTTAVGAYAGYANSYNSVTVTEGTENTMIGYAAMTGNAFGSQNTAVGYKTMATYEPGSYSGNAPMRNVGVGDSALYLLRGNDNVAIGYRALSKSGANNHQSVAVGSRALLNATTFYPNTAVGYSSQDSLTTGAANTALGSYSLTKNKLGSNNTAVGNAAMMEAYNPSGINYPYDNTAIGNDALRFTRYYGHVAMGSGALRNDTSGVYNTAVGYLSMYNNLSGTVNTALGTSALRSNTTAHGNTALGTNTMYNHKTGDDNTAIGYESMVTDTAGSLNTAVGWRSLRYVEKGYENTAMGVGALEFTDSAFANTAVGRGAMIGTSGNTTNLTYNTALGWYAGAQMDSVNFAIAIGVQAGYNNRGKENTFIGYNSGFGGSGSNLTGIENVGVGTATLTYNNTGMSNTAVGLGALYGNRSGNGSVAIGTRALANGNSYSYNIAIGDSAMYGNNADANIAIGTKSMWFNNTGTQNSAIGNYALQTNATGSFNTVVGYQALVNSNGNGNTALGYTAGNTLSVGTFNTLLGYNADVSLNNFTNATAIGSNSYVGQSNSLILGSINGINGATADTKVGIGTTTPDSILSVADKFLVGSSGTVQYDNSVPVMNYMFKSGTLNAGRMVIAHSPANATWGLQYQDVTDQFNFVAGGVTKVAIELGSGQVGIGMNPTTQLELSLNSAQKPTSSAWFITSDERLKTIDGSYTKGLKDILKLNTITYHYNKGNQRKLPTDETGYGFSAQAVQKVFPEAVRLGKDGYLSLDMHPILVSYINAFKEQQQQIDELKKQNDLLIKRIEKLENK